MIRFEVVLEEKDGEIIVSFNELEVKGTEKEYEVYDDDFKPLADTILGSDGNYTLKFEG